MLFGRQVQRHFGQIREFVLVVEVADDAAVVPGCCRICSNTICFLLNVQDVSKKDIIKQVAEEWRALSNRERADWDEIARDDKLR